MHEVVDMYTGAHYACKIVDVRTEVTQWKIHSEIEFKMRVKKEVEIVQKLTHVSSLFYISMLASR